LLQSTKFKPFLDILETYKLLSCFIWSATGNLIKVSFKPALSVYFDMTLGNISNSRIKFFAEIAYFNEEFQ